MSAMFTLSPDLVPLDYLAIGHVCYDLVPGGRVVGGAAAYGASVALALGCRAGIVTSASAGSDWARELPGIPIHQVDAAATTHFENVYTPTGRRQSIHAVAGPLAAGDVPPLWTRAPVVHLGPIANEVDPAIVKLFSDSLIGVGPQGWMRRWDEDGRVYHVAWESAAEVLPLAAVTFISLEDLADPSTLSDLIDLSHIFVVTDGPGGCTVYFNGEERGFPAPAVTLADATGAGDIFAAAYLVRLHQTSGDIWEAAVFANRIAAASVTRQSLRAKIELIHGLQLESLRKEAGGV
jgi:sugar/nucleoside kinase (ribokinase family)